MASARTIGEVINELRDEFPEVTVSKIRFLETKGLVNPGRNHSGYREFTDDDLGRIRYILRQQRDHFLPLKVIKSKLTAWERGEEPGPGEGGGGPPPEAYFAGGEHHLDAEELVRATGISRAELKALEADDVVVPRPGPEADLYSDFDVAAVQAARRLLGHGLEPRHLRTLRHGAERTEELLRQLTLPMLRHSNPETRRRAAEILADCAEAAAELQQATLRSLLTDLLEG